MNAKPHAALRRASAPAASGLVEPSSPRPTCSGVRRPTPTRLVRAACIAAWLLATASLAACAGSSPRAEASGASTTGADPVGDSAGSNGSVEAAEAAASCRAEQPWADASCRFTRVLAGYCSGAALVTTPPPTWQCVCNQCLLDAHCTAQAGGRCGFSNQPFACSPSQGRCLYPGDACYDHRAVCPPSGMPP